MARLEARRWKSDATGLTRRDRRPCDYAVYLPDPLSGRRFVLDGDVAADVADAEAALVRLNTSADALADTEALARLLLRAESVASSRIEGLEVGGRRLLRADAARHLGEDPRDVTAAAVLGNIDAMVWGRRDDRFRRPNHRRGFARDAPATAGRYAPRRARRPHPHGAELDRGKQLQPLFGGVRAAAAGGGGRPPGGPLRLLQRRFPPSRGAGGHRPRAVRDDPPLRGRQRAHWTSPVAPGFCGGGGWHCASCRRSPSSSRRGHRTM